LLARQVRKLRFHFVGGPYILVLGESVTKL
jgi:hypothetical protein